MMISIYSLISQCHFTQQKATNAIYYPRVKIQKKAKNKNL